MKKSDGRAGAVRLLAGAVLLVCAGPAPLAGQAAGDLDPERAAQLARSAAGIRVGPWLVSGLRETEGASSSTWPLLEGYFQRGIDMHIVIESAVGVWRRREQVETTGGPLGGSDTQTVTSWVVPLLTAVKFYPATRPGDGVEPYALVGVGFALGVEDRQGSGGGLFGGGSGTSMLTGFGAKAGAGADVRLSQAFGLSAGVLYQWLRFGDALAGNDTYAGPGFTGGVTYRFRY
jgi:opacity protein-like surface antigen